MKAAPLLAVVLMPVCAAPAESIAARIPENLVRAAVEETYLSRIRTVRDGPKRWAVVHRPLGVESIESLDDAALLGIVRSIENAIQAQPGNAPNDFSDLLAIRPGD